MRPYGEWCNDQRYISLRIYMRKVYVFNPEAVGNEKGTTCLCIRRLVKTVQSVFESFVN